MTLLLLCKQSYCWRMYLWLKYKHYILSIVLLVPAVVQGHRNVIEVDTREIQEDAAKNSILMYDPDIVKDIKEMEAERLAAEKVRQSKKVLEAATVAVKCCARG